MLYEIAKQQLSTEEFKLFDLHYKLFKKIKEEDVEICDAYILYNLFLYKNLKAPDARVDYIESLCKTGVNIDTSLLETLGVLLKKDSYEHDTCSDISTLVDIHLIEPEIPLGYVNEEIKRAFILHEEITDDLVESHIDSLLMKYQKLFYMKTPEVQSVAFNLRVELFGKIMNFVQDEGDLLLMKQIQEILFIVIEWEE